MLTATAQKTRKISDYGSDFTWEDAYEDWLATMDREDVKMMAMMLHDNYTSRFGLTHTSPAAEVAQLLGFNKKTIRLWKKGFLANKGEFSEYQIQCHCRAHQKILQEGKGICKGV